MAILQMVSIDGAKKIHAAAIDYHKGKAAEHEAHLKRLELADTPIEQLHDAGLDKLLNDISEDIQGVMSADAQKRQDDMADGCPINAETDA